MSPGPDRRAARHERMRASLLAAAWDLAHEDGLAGMSQRALAERVDLAQPSLYSYFSSKNALYDAMFADGNRQLLEQLRAVVLPDEPMEALLCACRVIMDFFVADPVRYQLLFQRNLPGFEPSAESYALAKDFYEWHRARLEAVGVHGQQYMDVFVALQAGLAEAQLANEPQSDRWTRHLDWVIEMFVRAALDQQGEQKNAGSRSRRASSSATPSRRSDGDGPRRQPEVVQRRVRNQLPDGGTAPRGRGTASR